MFDTKEMIDRMRTNYKSLQELIDTIDPDMQTMLLIGLYSKLVVCGKLTLHSLMFGVSLIEGIMCEEEKQAENEELIKMAEDKEGVDA